MPNRSEELVLRRALGVPDDAERVLVLAESSHWDPDWLYTSEEYYRRFVERNLDQAVAALQAEPRRIYSVECIFFLRMYWERRPAQQDLVRQLVNAGRLRLTSSGVTTADTLLPGTEAILRDLLLGQEWLRENGMMPEPRLAYFADSFGCSPALPSLLRAAGFDYTAITRIDGMLFPGCDLEPARNFPRPGSSAARLLHEERSLDFVWRDMNGAEVLAHWNAFTYAQGDLLAHRGVSRVYLFRLAFPDPSADHVARRIARYVRQLAPCSRTPYLFCPIGFDFVEPIPDLTALLDRYNRLSYPTTGTWVVNAGLDDYLALVACHRDALPVVALDPNPYWTGFYTARPALKRRCHELVERLLQAECLAQEHRDRAAWEELAPAWWTAATANHHDFITGTSPDAVVEGEQLPWLEQAAATIGDTLRRSLLGNTALASGPHPTARRGSESAVGPSQGVPKVPAWRRQGPVLRVETPYYAVDLSEEAGGGILWATGPAGEPYLGAPSNDLLGYRDTGGLWRMGHEFRGGALQERQRASGQYIPLEARETEQGLEVIAAAVIDGEAVRRTLWFRQDMPIVRGQVAGRAAPGRTVCLLFATGDLVGPIVMAQPGGIVGRPLEKGYHPTFWPAQDLAHLRFPDGRGLAFFVRDAGAVAGRPGGRVEWVALRNATRERAYGCVPLPANPAAGHERTLYAFDYAFLFTPAGDWRENGLWSMARQLRQEYWGTFVAAVTVEPSTVVVLACKPASRGEGLIVRLYAPAGPAGDVTLSLPGQAIQSATLCDARERDQAPLPAAGGRVSLAMPGAIATVRVIGERLTVPVSPWPSL